MEVTEEGSVPQPVVEAAPVPAVAAAPAEAGAPAAEAAAPMDLMTALGEVMKKAMVHDGLARGLREAVKALDRRDAKFCVIAEDCDEPSYSRLIDALCKQHNIPVLKVPNKEVLGDLAGLYKLRRDGTKAHKTTCSCVVVRNFGEESQATAVVVQALNSSK